MHTIGIRAEDKHQWEHRAPLTPAQVESLIRNRGVSIFVEPSDQRAFKDLEYQNAGAVLTDNINQCDIILGVKEIPPAKIADNKVYVFFSHTIKGQKYNMPLLQTILDKKCTLIDYERIVDSHDRRLISFGRHAGLAGMIDALHLAGRVLKSRGLDSPFSLIRQSIDYFSSQKAVPDIKKAGLLIKQGVLKNAALNASSGAVKSFGPVFPFVTAFTGYGTVSKGAQEIFDYLPYEQIKASELEDLFKAHEKNPANTAYDRIYKVVFKESDTVAPIDSSRPFDLQDYFRNPQNYKSTFMKYFDYISILMNCVFWTPACPRIITVNDLKKRWHLDHRLLCIGDISCDIEGSIECTVKSTMPDKPCYVYDLNMDKAVDGIEGFGPVINAVDTLPAEIPVESSHDFGSVLMDFVPALANADYNCSHSPGEGLACSGLPPELLKAAIAFKGGLCPDYEYISKFL